jgi:hypothetical protein
MKRRAGFAAALFAGLILAASTGFAEELKYSGFLGDNYKLLEPGPQGGAKELYLKPGVDFRKYKSFMIDSVVFFLADDSEYKGIDPTEMKELADQFHRALLDAFTNGQYAIAVEPAPDVARIKFAITNIKESRPVLSGISSILPIGLAISTIKKGATGGWTGSGATSAEMMALDSSTNEIIGLAVDERHAGFGDRFSNWGSSDEAFKFWADRIVQFLDSVNGR